jgi:hypothetical protein
MALVQIAPPPGFRFHGTDLESEGRWRDGSLVRWRDGSLRPVGGWVDRIGSAPYNAAPRGMLGWEANDGTRWIAAGTYNKLYATTGGGTTYDITPATLTAGTEDATVNTGYGGGFYGQGFYGQPVQATGQYSEATTWSLENWGQYLVACNPSDGKLWEWQLGTGSDAAVIANAPTDCLGLVVTEDRFIFALGADGNPRKVSWCDFENNQLWAAASTNQAGDITLQTGGQIMAGIRTAGQTLILTDQDAHRSTYVGPPFIHQFERVSSACGLIARKAVVDTPAGVFWMSSAGFFSYDGSSVREIQCDVHDKVFSDLNPAQISKCWAVSNGPNGEVWFYYPSANSLEIDRYVVFDYKEGHWSMGALARTSGFDRGVFKTPVWGDPDGSIYNHETGFNYDGGEVYAESGPFKIGAGENLAVVTSLIPDELNLGDVTTTFKTRLYPTSTETSHGPYTLTQPTSVRLQGRQVRMKVTGNTPSAWRVGKFRFEAKPGGKR